VDSWLHKLVVRLFFNIVGRTAVDGARIYLHSCLVLGKKSHGSFTDWLIGAEVQASNLVVDMLAFFFVKV